MVHYTFLSEPRTDRLVLEPKSENKAVIAVFMMADFHKETVRLFPPKTISSRSSQEFDFPYKRSTMLLNSRERFFGRPVLP
jgi:N5-hydroxy-L-ornithine N5-transacylase